MYASICNFGSYGASLIPVWLQNLLNYDHAMWLLYSVNLMSIYGYGGVMTNVPIFLLPKVLFLLWEIYDIIIWFYMDNYKSWKIMNWNLRGINSEKKWVALSNKIEVAGCDIICL
jgi:hypothetical protein